MTEPRRDPDPPPPPKPRYLPRLQYQEPSPPADPPAPEPPAKASEPRPKKKRDKAEPAETPGATPDLETYQGRRAVRIGVSSGLAGVIVLSGFLVLRSLGVGGGGSEPAPEGKADAIFATMPPPAPRGDALESQARQLLKDARLLEKDGKTERALNRLEKVTAAYPKTAAAKDAAEALGRHAQGLPLFPDGPAIVAKKAAPAPEPETPKAEAGVADAPPAKAAPTPQPAPTPPAPRVAAGPAVPPEPRRVTGVGLERADVPARPLPPGFRAREEAGVHPSGWPLEITCDRDGAAMVFVPGGSFVMGRDDGPPAERPAHRVTLSPYYIDQHEVTARQLALFRGGPPSEDNRPAVGVGHRDAWEYARWAGKALPTEAQWEMAARTIDGRVHPWGNAPPSWDRPRAPGQIDPVMSFPTDLSPYGVFDLAGNAWEWTNDFFDTRYYQQFRRAPALDPTGPARPRGRTMEFVVKGGSKAWDAAWRVGMKPETKLPSLGFRCALQVDRAAAPNVPAPEQKKVGPGAVPMPF